MHASCCFSMSSFAPKSSPCKLRICFLFLMVRTSVFLHMRAGCSSNSCKWHFWSFAMVANQPCPAAVSESCFRLNLDSRNSWLFRCWCHLMYTDNVGNCIVGKQRSRRRWATVMTGRWRDERMFHGGGLEDPVVVYRDLCRVVVEKKNVLRVWHYVAYMTERLV